MCYSVFGTYLLSRLLFTEDMEYVIRACEILHNMIVEYRDDDYSMGMMEIVSIDPKAEVIPIRTVNRPVD